MNPLAFLKFLHILFAILSVGSNVGYGFWLLRAQRDREKLLFVLKNIRVMDRYLANPAYTGLAVTGPLMVWCGGYSWQAPWIWVSASLLVLAAVLGITIYAPLLKRQIQALESRGPGSAQYRALEKRSNLLGVLLWVLVAVILFLMVVKPG